MNLPTHFSQQRVLRGHDRSRECLIRDSLGPANSENRARSRARKRSLKGAEISPQNKDTMAETSNRLNRCCAFHVNHLASRFYLHSERYKTERARWDREGT